MFNLPANLLVMTPLDEIARGREPLPSISSLLRGMGEFFEEPGWLDVAYSLLSQTTHSTPIGQMHTVRFRDGIWHGGEITPEMLALTLDIACLSSAILIGLSARIVSENSNEAQSYQQELMRRAGQVHRAAQLVHYLD